MKIIPQNGFMHVELLGRGDRLTPSGLVQPEDKPMRDDLVSVKILAIDQFPQPATMTTNEIRPYSVGQTVMTQCMCLRPIRPEVDPKAKIEPIGDERTYSNDKTVTAMIMARDVMAVVEEDDQPQS